MGLWNTPTVSLQKPKTLCPNGCPSYDTKQSGGKALILELWETQSTPSLLLLQCPLCTNVLASHHHHHVVPPARISLTLSRHFSLSFIAFGRSSGLHPVSSHSCCMYVRTGRPAFAWPYAGVHRSTSLMGLFLLLQQCPACLVRLTCIVFVMGGKCPYSWCLVVCCLVVCCRQDLFNIALNILV